MHDIEMNKMSTEFLNIWNAAGEHLQEQINDCLPRLQKLYPSNEHHDFQLHAWLKAYPYPPFLEHLSFRLGNQMFFVRVEDVSKRIHGPGSLNGLRYIAESNRGHACLLPMTMSGVSTEYGFGIQIKDDKIVGCEWVPHEAGWGLIDANTGKPLDPMSLVTDEKIEMTPWELQDTAVQIVKDFLENEGYQIMSWQGDPDVDPSLWFIGDSNGPEWVVVRAVKRNTKRPDNWQAIASGCSHMSQIGHYAPVELISFGKRLYRGYSMVPMFSGLE
jgi:hypothetical protein